MLFFRPWFPVLVLLALTPGVGVAATDPPPSLDNLSAEGHVVTLDRSDGVVVRLSFLAEDTVRIEAAPGGRFSDEDSGQAAIVIRETWPEVAIAVQDEGAAWSLSTSVLEMKVVSDRLLLELHRVADGKVLWRELRPLRLSEHGTTQTLSSDVDEHYLGGGQQNGAFEFNGRLLEISYSGGWEEGDRPSPAPFYMSDRGYGLLRNTWTDGTYDFRSDDYLTTTHTENRFDAYLMVADSFHGVLDLYTQLTGRAPLLPRWAFGYGDADCYNDGDNVNKPGTVPDGWSDGPTGTTPDVVAMAQRYRDHDMPGSWILPNDGYGCGYTDLPEVVTRLADLGFRTGLWTEDGVEKIAWEVGTAGTRAQKLDVAWTGQGRQWSMDANHEAARGILDNSSSRPFVWTVMGWAGIQRYAVTWTGDQSGSWDFIRWHVPTVIGSGLSGMNYSTGDVDGIFGGSPELYTRDLQWKAFTPVLMGMSGWSRSERKHPWWFDEPHRSIHRRYLKLRQRLMPYLYTLARETETTGAPMVRGVLWDHPEDPRAFDVHDQFFLGRDLLVAPVYRSQAASGGVRTGVYLPAGRWIDYWNGTRIEAGPAGRMVDIPVDLETLPVLVRAGAVIPMVPESLYDGQVPPDPLTLDVYPHGSSELVLYEDDGNTREYRDGRFSTQRFEVVEERNELRIQLDPAVGTYEGQLESRGIELQIHTASPPRGVTFEGTALTELGRRPAGEDAERGYFYDPEDRGGVLWVHTGPLDVRVAHRWVVDLAGDPFGDARASGYPTTSPSHGGSLASDALRVVGRPAEEPGHRLENAFDGDPDTWFRTIRDQSVAYGPHELTLSLGGRQLIDGFRIRPRNDRHWKYGQVRDFALYLSDNGTWGEPVVEGTLDQLEGEQEVRFPATAGRLLRLRVLSTHDDEVDPMVLDAAAPGDRAFDALAPVRVGPIAISELRFLQPDESEGPPVSVPLGEEGSFELAGLVFERGLGGDGRTRFDFALERPWHTFAAEAGLVDSAAASESVRFQVWGDDRLLWDSGPVNGLEIVKPRIDVRGLKALSLRIVETDPGVSGRWVDPVLVGTSGDTVWPLGKP